MNIWVRIKKQLERVLPPTARMFQRRSDALKKRLAAIEKHMDAQTERMDRITSLLEPIDQRSRMTLSGAQEGTEALLRQNAELSEKMAALEKAFLQVEARLGAVDMAQKDLGDVLRAKTADADKALAGMKQSFDQGDRNTREAVWAEVFNNTIRGSSWLTDQRFSPGRWAVGYPYLYVLYRVLNEMRPRRILDLGLGQTSRMIGQYAASDSSVEHCIVEHNPAWVSFFQNDYTLPGNSRIVLLDQEMIAYKETETVRVFKGFREAFAGQVFDLISVDAPLGGDMKRYSRIDVLGILPDGLAENFVILIDDCERTGERNTVREIEACLSESGIEYAKGKYTGAKDMVLICAKNCGFLTSM